MLCSFPGISMLALVSVEGYHGYLMFVWMYGFFIGGFEVALKVYVYERLKIKQFSRGFAYIQSIKALPYLIGFPITAHISLTAGNPKAGFYFSFSCCFLGASVLFLMECFKGGYVSSASFYGGSRMELCKTDTNMSYELNGGLSQSGPPQNDLLLSSGPPGGLTPLPASTDPLAVNGHLKCTCLPSAASEMDGMEGMEEAVDEAVEASMALAEVSTASHNSKVTFNDEIQVVRENDVEPNGEEDVEPNDVEPNGEYDVEPNGDYDVEPEDDMIDLAEALYAVGIRPEILASISEENPEEGVFSDEELASGILEEEIEGLMWSEYQDPPHDNEYDNQEGDVIQKRLVASVSEPDLSNIKLPHPSSRPFFAPADAPKNPTVKRQKTWHLFSERHVKKNLKECTNADLTENDEAATSIMHNETNANAAEVTSYV